MNVRSQPKLLGYNALFWLCVAGLQFIGVLIEMLAWNTAVEAKYLWFSLASIGVQVLMTSVLILWFSRVQGTGLQMCLATVVVAACYIPFANVGGLLLKDEFHFNPKLLIGQLDTHVLAFFVWATCYLTYIRYQQRQWRLQQSSLLSQNIQQLELQALRHQLNPHFTFNALNSVCALLEAQRYDDAETMSEQLSTFLRYSLSNSPDSLVRLADELAAIEAYLTLQKTRFGDKLRVNWQIDESLKQQKVPALLLQPLVENAIKYAVASRKEGATITIGGQHIANQLKLMVTDDGPGSSCNSGHSSTGIGLRNIRDRLTQHFGENAKLAIHAKPGSFAVDILLPWQVS